jgi:hypothetical protein
MGSYKGKTNTNQGKVDVNKETHEATTTSGSEDGL